MKLQFEPKDKTAHMMTTTTKQIALPVKTKSAATFEKEFFNVLTLSYRRTDSRWCLLKLSLHFEITF